MRLFLAIRVNLDVLATSAQWESEVHPDFLELLAKLDLGDQGVVQALTAWQATPVQLVTRVSPVSVAKTVTA